MKLQKLILHLNFDIKGSQQNIQITPCQYFVIKSKLTSFNVFISYDCKKIAFNVIFQITTQIKGHFSHNTEYKPQDIAEPPHIQHLHLAKPQKLQNNQLSQYKIKIQTTTHHHPNTEINKCAFFKIFKEPQL